MKYYLRYQLYHELTLNKRNGLLEKDGERSPQTSFLLPKKHTQKLAL